MKLWRGGNPGGYPNPVLDLGWLIVNDYGKGNYAFGIRGDVIDIGRYAFLLCVWKD